MSTTFDGHKNFASTTVVTVPTPAASGTTLVVADGTFGGASPSVPFNVSIFPSNAAPTPTTAEVVRVTNISTNTLTITRLQESSSARAITVGDNVVMAITVKALTDIEAAVNAIQDFLTNQVFN
jgi:hypothetical protein